MSESQEPANDAEAGPQDPEILALLGFEPVPRQIKVDNGWTPALQRAFIARLAVHGSASRACEELGKNRTGINKLFRSPSGASFRAAWDGAVELATRRKAEAAQAEELVSPGTRPPTLDNRRTRWKAAQSGPLPGQVRNEYGEWEEEASVIRRAEDARDSMSTRLLVARRLYLQEISGSAGKRAAFEILTELAVDWEKAERLEAQPDEPFRPVNMREPDMLLTAENGWLGDLAHGPDKKAELRRAIDDHRAEEGLPPVEWEGL